jgi:hypothetical protein
LCAIRSREYGLAWIITKPKELKAMIRPTDAVLAATVSASLRDMVKATPDHPAARFVLVFAGLIDGAVKANDGDYLASLLGLDFNDETGIH